MDVLQYPTLKCWQIPSQYLFFHCYYCVREPSSEVLFMYTVLHWVSSFISQFPALKHEMCSFRAGPSLNAFNYDSVYGKKALVSTYKSIMDQVGFLDVFISLCKSSWVFDTNHIWPTSLVVLAEGQIWLWSLSRYSQAVLTSDDLNQWSLECFYARSLSCSWHLCIAVLVSLS